MSKFYLFLSIFLLQVAIVCGQTGKIKGKVLDNNGEVVVGATVLIKDTKNGAITAVDGTYEISSLADGDYEVVTNFMGFKNQQQKTTVSNGGETVLDFNLEEDFLSLDDVVVTGTFDPQSKLESTVSITTLDQKMIEQQAPRSTGDLIDAIPGFYVESGLGETANNIYPRGLPIGTGGLRYTALREDGLNNFEVSDKVFFNADAFTKNDLTIERLEGLRGGNAVIFSSNTPGGIINFVSKTGGTDLKGDVKYTYGTQQMYRVDANLGGPLTKDKKWRFNIGGHYRHDKGLRDFTGPANVGGQIKANVTRLFDNNKGYIRFSGKILDDKVAFWTAVPYQGFDNPRPISGWSKLNQRSLIPANAGDNLLIPDPLNPGQNRRINPANVVKVDYKNIGMEFKYDLGNGWQVKNQARYMQGTTETNLTQVVANPVSGRALLANVGLLPNGTTPGAYTPIISYTHALSNSGAASILPNNINGGLIPLSSLSSNADGGGIGVLESGINGNGMLLPLGIFVINSQNTNLMNNLQFSKQIKNHSINIGSYISAYESDEYWNFNTALTDLSSNPRFVDIQFRGNGGLPTFDLTRNGILQAGIQYRKSVSKNLTSAVFVGDEIKLDSKLTATLGFRYEINQSSGSLQNVGRRDGRSAGIIRAGAPVTVGIGGGGGWDSNPLTLYDTNADIPLPTYMMYDMRVDVWGANIGANYKMNETTAFFFNSSRGTRYATTQNFISNKDQGTITGTAITGDPITANNGGFTNNGSATDARFSPVPLQNPVETLLQGEVGMRMSKNKFGLTATLFAAQINDAAFTLQSTDANGNLKLDVLLYDVRNIGFELEAIYAPIRNLKFNGSLSLQSPKYTKYPDVTIVETNQADQINPALPPTTANASRVVNFSGNNVERVPPIQFDFTVDYTIKKFNIFANMRYIGARWANRRNTYKLPGFSEVGAGINYKIDKFVFGAQVINLFDVQGITEGNTRTQDNVGPNAAQNNNTINTGIFVLPRSANFTVQYSF